METTIVGYDKPTAMKSSVSQILGLYRCPGNPPFVCVMEGARCGYLSQEVYRQSGHKPAFEALPWEADYRAVRKP